LKTIAAVLATALATQVFAAGVLPDHESTEGSVRSDGHELAKVCDRSTKHRGPMTKDRRDEVLIRYGLPPGEHPDYEIDHLIPFCLGGSDDFTNLWPQPRRTIEPEWNAEVKDRLERRVCEMVCTGDADLATAQEDVARNWIDAYRKYMRPLPKRQSFIPPEGFGLKPRPPVEPPKRSTNPIFVPPETFAAPEPRSPAAETKIPFIVDSHAIVVPGRINDAITVDFALDSGAALASIPLEVYQALRRIGSVIESDITGEEDFVVADGRLIREKTFIIQSLKVGDVTVYNVGASTGGPVALLGQSFLKRFKSWQIDNSKHVVILGRQT
jgi:hypothetical protein